MDDKTLKNIKVCKTNMQGSVSYYEWQKRLRKDMGAEYVGPSMATINKVLRGLRWGLDHFKQMADAEDMIRMKEKQEKWADLVRRDREIT